ncbi:hypothetical protein BDR04DRAFT_1150782 [Suillus decipiens]|nr:hypothetical protein BDR04DRAFT_1150782 [Suillus decipiens]
MRTCITELLATCQSAITMEDEGTMDSGVLFHALVDNEHQVTMPQYHLTVASSATAFRLGRFTSVPRQAFKLGAVLYGSPVACKRVGSSPSKTSGFISYKLGVPEFLPQD